MRIRALILLPFLVGFSLIAAQAQSSVTLQVGVPIDRTLGPDQTHEFAVDVKENSFVQLVIEQKGIDVVVRVSNPDGKLLSKHDTPNGAEGSEHVSFVTTAEGKYRITVSPLGQGEATTGHYQIKLVEVRDATEEEIAASKNREAAKAKGIALLLDLRDAIGQIKNPQTRISAQLMAASMLRENDDKGAAKYLSDALADLKAFLAAADADGDNYMSQFSAIAQLRDQMVRILAETDPDAALNFLHSTTPKYSPYGSTRELAAQESALELAIVDQIARKDPARAVQVAKQNLKKTYSQALLNTASQLEEKNPELARELMHDITTKLLNEEKLISNPDAASLALAVINSLRITEQRPVRMGPDSAWVQTSQQLPKGLISEQEQKQLVQKIIREVLAYSFPNGRMYAGAGDAMWTLMAGLRSLGPDIDKVVSGSFAALEKKQTELVGNQSQYVNQFAELQNAIANNPVESALEAIEKAPSEIREQLYTQLATREAQNGDMSRAKQILNDHIANPYQRNQALRSLEQTEIDQAMSSGKVEDALKNISALRSPVERAEQLSQLASQIGPGQKRATALSLLEQARGLLPQSAQAEDQGQMSALLEIARAFSNYDSKRSFEIVDPLIDQFNDICTAARSLQGFGVEYFQNDELDMQGEGALAQLADQMSNVLGDLALINFDRSKAETDKLRLPEVRLHAYLQIAQRTIGGPKDQK